MVYRIQNHALDLTLPGTNDALHIMADSQNAPMCSQIPQQISTEELQRIIPTSWITNYEKLHSSHTPIQSSEATFTTQEDGSTLITFKKPQQPPTGLFPTQYMMTLASPEQDMEILSFRPDGQPQYAKESQTGHCYWDECYCLACIKEYDHGDHPIKPKKISSGKKLKTRYQNGDNQVGTLGRPSGKFDYLVTYSPPPRTYQPIKPTGWNDQTDDHPRKSPPPPSPPAVPKILPCYKQAQKYLRKEGICLGPTTQQQPLPQVHMMTATSSEGTSYEDTFPTLQAATTKDGFETRQPKVLNPRIAEPDGSWKKVSPAEAVLNWQSENLIAQNKVLQKIDHKISQVESKIDQSNIGLIKSQTIIERLEGQIQMLHQELMRLAKTSSFSSRIFAEREAEMKSLQTQLAALQRQANTGFSPPMSSVPWQFATIPKQEQPLPVVPHKEDHILRLRRLLDEDDALRKLKGK